MRFFASECSLSTSLSLITCLWRSLSRAASSSSSFARCSARLRSRSRSALARDSCSRVLLARISASSSSNSSRRRSTLRCARSAASRASAASSAASACALACLLRSSRSFAALSSAVIARTSPLASSFFCLLAAAFDAVAVASARRFFRSAILNACRDIAFGGLYITFVSHGDQESWSYGPFVPIAREEGGIPGAREGLADSSGRVVA